MSKGKPEKARPGRKPETLKIEGDWTDAVASGIGVGRETHCQNWQTNGPRLT
jgi:hypothetical protein